jgi:hypothetical protein
MLMGPVAVASGDRSFFKLKINKNYLRTAVAQVRLRGSAVSSIEREVACSIDCGDLIAEFAARKSRRLDLL